MKTAVPAILLALAAGACTSSGTGSLQHVVFSTGTVLGVDIVAVGADGQGARVGYQRMEFVSMPVVQHDADGGVITSAFPVLSLFSMDTGALLSTDVTAMRVLQVFATGEAATQVNAPAAVASAAQALALATLWSPEVVALSEEAVQLVDLAWATDATAAGAAASATLAGGQALTLEGLEAAIAKFEARHPKMIRYALDRGWLEETPAEERARQIAKELVEVAAHYEEVEALAEAISELDQVAGG